MTVLDLDPKSPKPFCVFGVVNNELGLTIAEEMLEWLNPIYHVIEVIHDGSLFEQPALRYMQDLVISNDKPCLYLHTKGAFNRQDLSDKVRLMWKKEFGERSEVYFSLVDRPYSVVACPLTGNDKTTWYNGFVVNSLAMKEIPLINPNPNRMKFERLFIGRNPQVIGVLRNDVHREFGHVDSKFKEIMKLCQLWI